MNPLRITFLLPTADFTGGARVVAIHARLLQAMGHQVLVLSQPAVPPTLRQRLRTLHTTHRWPRHVTRPPSHLDGTGVTHRVLDRPRPVRDSDLPDADVVIATWWETAEWVAALSPAKGTKVHFIQHLETFEFQPLDRVHAVYRLPLHRIVIAQWLRRAMAEDYGDAHCDLVGNSVDHAQFFASARSKQAQPTVGLLLSDTAFKDLPTALAAVRAAQQQIGQPIRLQAFAQHAVAKQAQDLHFAALAINPPQHQIRAFYAGSDVWLTASRSEGFNLPAMEAMACRTPVVATRTGWPEEAIVPGDNGYLCDVGDVGALAGALVRILTADAAEWQRMSQAAFDTVKDSSWEQATRQFAQALAGAVARRPH